MMARKSKIEELSVVGYVGAIVDLNKSDARFLGKYPWVVDLENMAMPSARVRLGRMCLTEKDMFKELTRSARRSRFSNELLEEI